MRPLKTTWAADTRGHQPAAAHSKVHSTPSGDDQTALLFSAPGSFLPPIIQSRSIRAHAHAGRNAVGQRTVTGEDDAFQTASFRLGRVFDRVAIGVLAQRGVAVGLVEQRNGHFSKLNTATRDATRACAKSVKSCYAKKKKGG